MHLENWEYKEGHTERQTHRERDKDRQTGKAELDDPFLESVFM